MNFQQYLNSKGYNIKQININGAFNLGVFKDGKRILHISTPPNVNINTQELTELVKNQIELYEGEMNEQNREEPKDRDSNQGCEEIHQSVEEPNKVS